MLGNILIMVVIAALAVLFFWLAVRAARMRSRWASWPLRILTGLVGLLFTAIFILAVVGYTRLNAPAARNETAAIPVTASAEKVSAAGKRLALCTGCHSSTGSIPLDGSKDNFFAGDGPPLGVLYAPNLTPGGPLKNWSDAEIIRAIREGVDNQGRPLVIMPSSSFHYLSDEDVQAIVMALRAQPAVNRDLPGRSLSPVAAAIVGSGVFPTSAQAPITTPVQTPAIGTAEYGKYVTMALACQDCHGPEMTGMSSGGFGPSAPNAKVIVKSWSEADFIRFFHEGKDPTGRVVDPENMPWKEYGQALTDEELKSVYLYLHSQP